MNKVKKVLTAAVFAITLSAPQWAIAETIVVLKAEQAMFATGKAIALGQQLSAQLKPQPSVTMLWDWNYRLCGSVLRLIKIS